MSSHESQGSNLLGYTLVLEDGLHLISHPLDFMPRGVCYLIIPKNKYAVLAFCSLKLTNNFEKLELNSQAMPAMVFYHKINKSSERYLPKKKYTMTTALKIKKKKI